MSNNLINIPQEIKNNQQIQLSPLKPLFRIQFDLKIRHKLKLIKTWIKNPIIFRHRRKVGLINQSDPRDHYKIYKCITMNLILKSITYRYTTIINLIAFIYRKLIVFKMVYSRILLQENIKNSKRI